MNTQCITATVLALNYLVLIPPTAQAVPVQLDPGNTESTFNQGGFSPAAVVDNNPATRGWAISGNPPDGTGSAEAMFGTLTTLQVPTVSGFPALPQFSFIMEFQDPAAEHLLGLFRLSVTDDPTPTLAGSTWTHLVPTAASASDVNTTLTLRGDNAVLATGSPVPANGTYTVDTDVVFGLSQITAFRLEAIDDDSTSLPTGGPGRASNGNFVITDLIVDVTFQSVPEPSSAILLGIAGMALVRRTRSRTT